MEVALFKLVTQNPKPNTPAFVWMKNEHSPLTIYPLQMENRRFGSVIAAATCSKILFTSMLEPIPGPILTLFDDPVDCYLYSILPQPTEEFIRDVVPLFEPSLSSHRIEQIANAETIQGYPIVNSQRVAKPDLQILKQNLQTDSGSAGEPKRCFDPHHAIRVDAPSKRLEVIICYLCNSLQIFQSDELKAISCYISGNSEQFLDSILKKSR